MTKADLLAQLLKWGEIPSDPEIAHREADMLLLAYINDPEITNAFDAIEKWYA